MACFETAVKAASMVGVNATSSSAQWAVILRNFTFPVIHLAFIWGSFQFHENIPEASWNGAALGSALTIFIGTMNFHYITSLW